MGGGEVRILLHNQLDPKSLNIIEGKIMCLRLKVLYVRSKSALSKSITKGMTLILRRIWSPEQVIHSMISLFCFHIPFVFHVDKIT